MCVLWVAMRPIEKRQSAIAEGLNTWARRPSPGLRHPGQKQQKQEQEGPGRSHERAEKPGIGPDPGDEAEAREKNNRAQRQQERLNPNDRLVVRLLMRTGHVWLRLRLGQEYIPFAGCGARRRIGQAPAESAAAGES